MKMFLETVPIFLFFIAVLIAIYGKRHPESRRICEFLFLIFTAISIFIEGYIRGGYLRMIALACTIIFVTLIISLAFNKVKLIR